jgi:hypothetical protein
VSRNSKDAGTAKIRKDCAELRTGARGLACVRQSNRLHQCDSVSGDKFDIHFSEKSTTYCTDELCCGGCNDGLVFLTLM